MSGIFLKQGNQLTKMVEQEYYTEDLLQGLLAEYPDLLAGEQIDSENPRKWLLIKREMGVPSQDQATDQWRVDLLFIDQDAIPTLVEVKRSSNKEIRRQIVGQMLDYASNAVVYWSENKMRQAFITRIGSEETANAILIEWLSPESDIEQFWQKAQDNLKNHRIRLLFVADKIPAELQRIVEFLNTQMKDTEVLAVEIKQFKAQGSEAVYVPRVIGLTQEAIGIKSTRNEKQWDEDKFLADLEEKRSKEEVQIAKEILEWSQNLGLKITWGKGIQNGSFAPGLTHNGLRYWFFTIWSDGFIVFYLSWNKGKSFFENDLKRSELLNKLNFIPGIKLTDEEIKHKQPKISLAILKDTTNLKDFLDVFEWYIQEIKNS